MHEDQIRDLEVLLGHIFRSRSLLLEALSHSSIKTSQRPSNERLEFLGDSVLGLIIADALFRRFPEEPEGTLTRIKSHAVSRQSLGRVATAMGLERFLLVGKGVAKREIPFSLIGNLFEALMGAIYLDAGLAAARKFILRHLDVVIAEIVEDRAEKNYKSILQHHCQRELGGVPTYRVLREGGPAHSRSFDISVVVGGKEMGRARADSKKIAEQGAARAALVHLEAIDENPNKPVRGSGTVLRVGAGSEGEGGGRRRGRRSRRGRGDRDRNERDGNDRNDRDRNDRDRDDRDRDDRDRDDRNDRDRDRDRNDRNDRDREDRNDRGQARDADRAGAAEGQRERPSRRRGRRGRRRGRDGGVDRPAEGRDRPAASDNRPAAEGRGSTARQRTDGDVSGVPNQASASRTTRKKAAAKKTTKKTVATKATTKKTVRKKTAKKATTKKTASKKAPSKKTATKKTVTRKTVRKKTAKKTPRSTGGQDG